LFFKVLNQSVFLITAAAAPLLKAEQN